ncbi:MAG: carbohydrate ABC transporter permease [Oscillospiraceae bacterium]|jgi:multiple sugar transport system permease protein|nr:carbohydrate ABC transporter permease [Oscillospiraceae bacterium]
MIQRKNAAGRIHLLVARVVVYTILIFLSALCLFSFYLLIVNASRSNAQLQAGFSLLPQGNFFTNLKNAWNDASINIPRGVLNSFLVAGLTAVLTTYFSALTAYGIHAYTFRGKKAVFTCIMAVMMIPPQVSAVGFVQLMTKLGMTNSFLPLILPGIAAPVVFFYMKQYLESVLPMEIVEAARCDGSSEFSTFNRIVLPIMKPALAVQLIFSFVASWNNYFIPALLLDKAEMKTVPIMIAQLRSADYSKFDMGKVYMFILLAILPVLIVYIFLSRSIIKGVTAGSVKG